MSDTKAPAEVKEVNASSATAEDLAAPPEAVQMTDEEELGAAADKDTSDSGKLKTLLGILKRMIGVKDMAAIRLSLPANLLEPVPNLEYWNYLDRGDLFSTIPDFEDPLDRMLATLRFTFTKELKFVRGKVCKPYNSILGEHFRCHWDVLPPTITEEGDVIPRQALTGSEAKVLQQSTSSSAAGKASSTSGGSVKSGKPVAAAPASAKGSSVESSSDNASSTLSPPASSSAATSRPASVRGASAHSTKPDAVAAVEDAAATATVKAKKGFSKFLPGRRSGGGASDAGSAPPTPAVEKGPAAFTHTPAEPPISEGKATDAAGADDDDDDAGSFKSSKSQNDADDLPKLEHGKRRITFITEQVSHHPPISSFFVECKQSGVQLCGVDQLSAKFTGTSVRVYSGEQNQGIFVKLLANARAGVAGEEYQILHPTASINGLLRGTLWVAICDSMSVTCRGGVRAGESEGKTGPRLKAIVEYKDESWVLKAKYALEGVIYEYDESKGQAADEFDKIRAVPADRVVATFEGSWKGQIWWKRKGEKEARLLIDLNDLDPVPRGCRPLAKQEAWESRKIWQPVTKAILGKDYSAATKFKQDIEQKQRDAAVERKKKGEEFVPQFFEADISDGRPRLTAHGREALDGEARLAGYDAPADDLEA